MRADHLICFSLIPLSLTHLAGVLGTHLLHVDLRAERVGSLTAGKEESPATPGNDPAAEPAKEEELALAHAALVLVTYKQLFRRRPPPVMRRTAKVRGWRRPMREARGLRPPEAACRAAAKGSPEAFSFSEGSFGS